jgi:hypothetical protein
MDTVNHAVFGEIFFDVYWKRNYSLTFLSNAIVVTLIIDGDADAEFEDNQFSAFDEFERIKVSLIKDVEERCFQHYMSVCDENRKRFEAQAEELSPAIRTKDDLNGILSLKQIIVIESFDLAERKIGFIFDASFEPELGIGVECTNGQITNIGHQDIVL